jgi:hypothetical protein
MGNVKYKPRKPMAFDNGGLYLVLVSSYAKAGYTPLIGIFEERESTESSCVEYPIRGAKEARKLAAWLIKAADYLESKKK